MFVYSPPPQAVGESWCFTSVDFTYAISEFPPMALLTHIIEGLLYIQVAFTYKNEKPRILITHKIVKTKISSHGVVKYLKNTYTLVQWQ